MARSDQYRRYAAECVRVAQATENPREKALLLEMAETWRRLAEREDAEGAPDKNQDA